MTRVVDSLARKGDNTEIMPFETLRGRLSGVVVATAALLVSFESVAKDTESATLSVETIPIGATVSVDGEPLGNSPLKVQVEPGVHEVRISAEGYEVATRQVTASRGATQSINLALEASAVEYYTGEGHAVFWGGLGLGAAMAGAGHWGASDTADSIREGDLDAVTDNRYFSALAIGGYVVAAVGATLGAYLWQTPRRKEVQMLCYEVEQTGRRISQRVCIPRDDGLEE